MTIPGAESAEFQAEAKKVATRIVGKLKKNQPPASLTAYAINGTIEKLRKEMRDAVFIMEGIAIRGQYTAICAPPNGGKTLITLALVLKAVKGGVTEGDKIFYINVDDNMEGALVKAQIVEPYGIKMVVPVLADPEKTGGAKFNFVEIINDKIDNKKVDGEIIIIDTYKKFANTMNKEEQSSFNDVLRKFVTMGGSVIVLAHVNKNRDQEGNLVWGGTSDLKDDCDAGWIIDNSKMDDGITYEFFYQKGRGHSGDNSAFFSPASTHGTPNEDQLLRYQRLLDGLVPQSSSEAEKIRLEASQKEQKSDILRRFHPAVTFMKELLMEGEKTRTEIAGEYKKADVRHEISQRNFDKVVSTLSGDMWDVRKDGKRKIFKLNKKYIPKKDEADGSEQ